MTKEIKSVVQVKIVRTLTPWGELVTSIFLLLLASWLVMLILPDVIDGLNPGYWQTTMGILVIRLVSGSDSAYWTGR